jgi:hypothetical protein
MGASSSSIISELFLQYTECNFLAPIVNKHGISGYYRYVDDILILYDSSITNILSILHDFNNIHSNLQFTSETEIENNINYLDISIHRTDSDLTFHSKSTGNLPLPIPSSHMTPVTLSNTNMLL